MLNKKDYLNYLDQIYKVEMGMKREAKALMGLIKDKESREILNKLLADEIRHIKIVKEMMKIIKD